jgi:hypothetical protein
MGGEGNSPEGRPQDRREGQEPGGRGAAPVGHTRAAACWRASPAVPSLQDAFTTALRRRVTQRVARDLRRPSAPRGPYLRALYGCASAPGAASAVGWGDGRLCRVPAGDARG